MIKIDLHIHTSAAKYESEFDFSLDTLKQYVSTNKFDIIAITNHNHFKKDQFETICQHIDCEVLPGVEVDIEKSHLLVIAPKNKIVELDNSCSILETKIISENDSISFEEFINIFPNYRDYILIPHYKKEPEIKISTLEKFDGLIKVGEVKSAKKFEITKKDPNSLVPVFFSDIRMEDIYTDEEGKVIFPSRFTYVDVKNIDFNVLKNALNDKNKVFISFNKKDEEFTFLQDGTTASTGLNIILGKRSSGKTFNLEHIYSSKDSKDENIKYIKQFSLTGKSEEDTFKKLIRTDQQKEIDDYLEPIRKFTNIILDIDETNVNQVDKYLKSLKEFANNQSLQDSYAKTKMFNEIEYNFLDDNEINELIKSIDIILKSENNKELIEKYIDYNNLFKLLDELIKKRRKEFLEFKLKNITDKIVLLIKEKLNLKSSMTVITPVNLYLAKKELVLIEEFNNTINHLKRKSTIRSTDLQRFKLIFEKDSYQNVMQVKDALKITTSISNIFKDYYNEPYKYIHKLKEAGIPVDELYKALISFNVKAINENGNELSGGERAEYNLLREINDSEQYDVLLLDEPEASFDNPFINDYIVNLLKDLSKKTTIFIATHNNTLGMLIKPNKLIYTSNEEGNYKVYTGEFGCKELKTIDGEFVISYDTILSIMEAGEQAYKERKDIYETFKN